MAFFRPLSVSMLKDLIFLWGADACITHSKICTRTGTSYEGHKLEFKGLSVSGIEPATSQATSMCYISVCAEFSLAHPECWER